MTSSDNQVCQLTALHNGAIDAYSNQRQAKKRQKGAQKRKLCINNLECN